MMSGFVLRQLRKPGEDGCRTPTIEDPEHPAYHRDETSGFASTLCDGFEHDAMELPSHLGCKGRHFGHNPHYCHARDHSDELPGWHPPSKLSFKQRIKHVTWAYFTITMATGGIANVLSTGVTNTGPWLNSY